MTNNLEIVTDRIKASDPDRFRAAQLADPDQRVSLMWIYAFHLELAKVPELVSEPMIGDIRYQWWRDAIEEIYSGGPVRKHEVTTPLAKVLTESTVPRFWVDKLIDGRHSDLQSETFANIDAARDYCANTSGVLAQIAAQCLSHESDDDIVRRAGLAWGLTGLCRAYSFYHKTVLASLNFETLLKTAADAYEDVKGRKVRPDLMPAVGYAGLIPKYLKVMGQAGFDPKTDTITISPLKKQFRQLRVATTGKL